MPRIVSSEIIDHLATGKPYHLAFLVGIEFPEPNRLAFTTLLDNYDYDGDTFIGLGSIGSVSMPQGDGELSPKTYTVTLNGISDDILEAASRIDYLNHLATCWMIFYDDEHVQLGEPMIAWRGLTDQINVSYGKTSVVTCTIRDRMADWERPKTERYNHADQVAKYPNDKFFEFIAEIARKDAAWPEANWFKE